MLRRRGSSILVAKLHGCSPQPAEAVVSITGHITSSAKRRTLASGEIFLLPRAHHILELLPRFLRVYEQLADALGLQREGTMLHVRKLSMHNLSQAYLSRWYFLATLRWSQVGHSRRTDALPFRVEHGSGTQLVVVTVSSARKHGRLPISTRQV